MVVVGARWPGSSEVEVVATAGWRVRSWPGCPDLVGALRALGLRLRGQHCPIPSIALLWFDVVQEKSLPACPTPTWWYLRVSPFLRVGRHGDPSPPPLSTGGNGQQQRVAVTSLLEGAGLILNDLWCL
jgi:hypothetical protein